MARETVRFLLGNTLREIHNPPPDLTVLNYLRLEERRCGTKEGCAEGDCGACTVVVGKLEGETLRYRAVNACIQFVAALDGCQLLTVEDLSSQQNTLHPVQQALVDHNGTQCGFCTPGFVMSLFALYHEPKKTAAHDIDERLAGNLCRCTGYGSIVTAATEICAQDPDDRFAQQRDDTISQLTKLQAGPALRLRGPDGHYDAPENLADLSAAVLAHPDATLVAGGTDVGLWVTKKHRHLEHVISTTRVRELQEITCRNDMIEIGAAVTYSEALTTLAQHIPQFASLIERIGSAQIRNAGTIGGNIANGSPIGDTPPVLIALGAKLCLRRGEQTREILLEDFFQAYGKQDLQSGEFVEKVLVPLPEQNARFFVYKISKRFDQDISAVCAAIYVRLSGEREPTVEQLRIAFGGMAGIPARARKTEKCLLGECWSEASIEQAASALSKDFDPLTDLRASREYRLRVSQNLLRRAFLETQYPAESLVLARSGSHRYG